MLKKLSDNVPDAGDLADDIASLAEAAVDAVSSAAGHVPGLDDYRAAKRRRSSLMWTLGAIGLVLAVLVVLKKQKTGDDGES